jgi:hypothetical protein
MPITPLHFGVLAPVNHWLPGKVSVVSFTLINLWMDANAILYFTFDLDLPGELHDPSTHSFLAVGISVLFITILRFKWSRKWFYGALYGGVTHVILDMLIHPEMRPFYPIHWNPFYLGAHEPLSLLLVPFLVWFIAQSVSTARQKVQKYWEAYRP